MVVQALTTQGVWDAVVHKLLPDGVWLLHFCLTCESSKKQFIRNVSCYHGIIKYSFKRKRKQVWNSWSVVWDTSGEYKVDECCTCCFHEELIWNSQIFWGAGTVALPLPSSMNFLTRGPWTYYFTEIGKEKIEVIVWCNLCLHSLRNIPWFGL